MVCRRMKKIRKREKRKSVTVSFLCDDDVLNISQYGIPDIKRGQFSKSVTKSNRKIVAKYDSPELEASKNGWTFDNNQKIDESSTFENDTKGLFQGVRKVICGSEVVIVRTDRERDDIVAKATNWLPIVNLVKFEDSTVSSITPTKENKDLTSSQEPKTPYFLRTRLKKSIKKEVSSVDDIFDRSGSEYEPSDREDLSSDNSDCGVDNFATSLDDVGCKPKPVVSSLCIKPKQKYVFNSDDYFERKSSKVKTSNKTLDRLKTPRLALQEVTSLLKDYTIGHQKEIRCLTRLTSSFFQRWTYTLKEGFNILLYGIGSKRSILHYFHKCYLRNSKVLVINGYFPGLTVKEILNNLRTLLGMKGRQGLVDTFRFLDYHSHVFLIVHNLDGPGARSNKVQTVLASLAAHSRIHLLASIDHISAPLLWDNKIVRDFNFIWEDATSYLPYKNETSFECSMKAQRSFNLALSSLRNVFHSLNSNSKKIFLVLLNQHLENQKKEKGMQFSDLYRICRRNFIVSSDLALRTHLTEFIDHQLVKWRKVSDVLIIPLDKNVLQQFKIEVDNKVDAEDGIV